MTHVDFQTVRDCSELKYALTLRLKYLYLLRNLPLNKGPVLNDSLNVCRISDLTQCGCTENCRVSGTPSSTAAVGIDPEIL
jgi:hypothetical protein